MQRSTVSRPTVGARQASLSSGYRGVKRPELEPDSSHHAPRLRMCGLLPALSTGTVGKGEGGLCMLVRLHIHK